MTSFKPGLLTEAESLAFRTKLAQMNQWQLRVLASLLWLEKCNHDTSDLAGLPGLLDFLTPELDDDLDDDDLDDDDLDDDDLDDDDLDDDDLDDDDLDD